MGQNFNIIATSNKIREDVARHNENYATLRSNFGGAIFPTSPTTGQHCLRTDRGELIDGVKSGLLYLFMGDTNIGESGWITSDQTSPLLAEIENARGTKLSLDQRLDVTLNEDGTPKGTVTSGNQWVLGGYAFTYTSSTVFITTGNTTDIFLTKRRVKVNLSASVAYSEVLTATYDGGQDETTITLVDTILDNTLVSVEHALISLDPTSGSLNVYDREEVDEGLATKVSKTGNEIIAGIKTFSSSPIVPSRVLPTKTATDTILVDGVSLTVSSPVAGTDYYFSATAIQTVKDADTIGGFHYGLTAIAEAPTGNKTEADMVAIRGINAHSIWTNWFRPVANPEGMVYIGGKWYDIYLLNSEHITNGTSKAGLAIAGALAANGRAIPKIPLEYGGDGTVNYGKLTWFQACEIAKSHSKELIDYAEFPTIAYGVNEGKSSQTDGYEVVVGKIEHYSNLTSKYGIEQASGVQSVWGKDIAGNRDESSVSWAWRDIADARGQIYSLHNNHITAVVLGGHRINGVYSGSRASYWSHYIWITPFEVGCRFVCKHLELV